MDVQELNINNTTYDIKAKSVVDQNGGKLRFWTGTRTQYDAIATKDASTLYWVTDTKIIYLGDTAVGNFSSGRNIGEIVSSSLPLTDAGLHLLDGTRLSGDGIYGEFVQYIADLYAENPSANYFTTESAWQQSVTTYGVCGKFVYDSTNNTVRLPKYNSKIYTGGGTAPVVGNGLALGLTVGSNYNYGLATDTSPNRLNGYTTAYGKPIPTSGLSGGIYPDPSKAVGITTNATKSGIIVQLSDITTSLDGYYYIVIATTTKTDIQVDIDNIATDLNGKADVDLTNITDTAKIMMAHNAMPSNTYDTLTLGATGTTYTAPADGYFVGWTAVSTVNGQYIAFLVNGDINTSFASEVYRNSTNSYQHPLWVPVKKGDVMKVQYTLSLSMFRFYYAVGSESEAS